MEESFGRLPEFSNAMAMSLAIKTMDNWEGYVPRFSPEFASQISPSIASIWRKLTVPTRLKVP